MNLFNVIRSSDKNRHNIWERVFEIWKGVDEDDEPTKGNAGAGASQPRPSGDSGGAPPRPPEIPPVTLAATPEAAPAAQIVIENQGPRCRSDNEKQSRLRSKS
jgi:hypothetical protein